MGINLTRTFAIDNRESSSSISPTPYYFAGLALVVAPALVIGFILVFPVYFLVPKIIETEISRSTLLILTCSCFIVTILSSISSVGLAIVEGAGRLSLKHIATIVSTLLLALTAHPFTANFGSAGLAAAYIFSSLFLTITSIVILPRNKEGRSTSRQNSISIISKIWKDCIHTSGMVLLRTSFEPWTKLLVGTTGGLQAVASFELALKVATQARVLIQAAAQPLLYIGARSKSDLADNIKNKFIRANEIVINTNWYAMSAISVAAPIFSYLGFGDLPNQSSSFLIPLIIGGSINSMGVIGYYAHASSGQMGKLLNVHFRMMMINVTLGVGLSIALGPFGAVIAYAASYAYGGFELIKLWSTLSEYNSKKLWLPRIKPPLIATISIIATLVLIELSKNQKSLISASLVAFLAISAVFIQEILPSIKKERNG